MKSLSCYKIIFLLVFLISRNAWAQSELEDIKSFTYSNLPIPLSELDNTYSNSIGLIQAEYHDDSTLGKLTSLLQSWIGYQTDSRYRTGVVAHRPNLVFTTANAFLETSNYFSSRRFAFHPKYNSSEAPNSSEGLPIRQLIIFGSPNTGYAEQLEFSSGRPNPSCLAVAVLYPDVVSKNQQLKVTAQNNQKRIWSDHSKFYVGYAPELYTDVYKQPKNPNLFKLHKSHPTSDPFIPDHYLGIEYQISILNSSSNQSICALPSSLGAPLFVETSNETIALTGIIAGTTLNPSEIENTSEVITYARYFTDQDLKYLNSIGSSKGRELLSNEELTVETLQNIQWVENPNTLQVIFHSRTDDALAPIIAWSPISGVEHLVDYVIFRSTSPEGINYEDPFATVTETFYIDKRTSLFTTYYYWVCARYKLSKDGKVTYLSPPSDPAIVTALSEQELPAPSFLKSAPKNPYILNWQGVSKGKSMATYAIFRKDITDLNLENLDTIEFTLNDLHAIATDTYYTDTYANFSRKYAYTVRTHFKIEELTHFSEPTNIIIASPITAPTSAPIHFRKHPWYKQLTWDESNVPFVQYRIFRSLEAEEDALGELIAKTDSTDFIDTNALDNVKYYYRIQAFNIAGDSPISVPIAVQYIEAPATVPQNLVVDNPITKRLHWDAIPALYGEYEVYRKVYGSYEEPRLIGTTVENSFADTTASSDETYVYFIRAVNAAGISNNSEELTIKFKSVNYINKRN